jgi:hypothetical protein
MLVVPEGFEPSTYGLSGRCSTRLSYSTFEFGTPMPRGAYVHSVNLRWVIYWSGWLVLPQLPPSSKLGRLLLTYTL